MGSLNRSEGAHLLDRIRAFTVKYVRLPGAEYADTLALWVLHTHLIGEFDNSPRLIFKSAEKESGKTRALEVLEVLVPGALNTFNATVPAIFRLLEMERTTLLIDEVDAIFNPKAAKENEDLRALLNSGYRRGATVVRCVGEGRKMTVKKFPVFAATALAAIGDLPDTIESRGIVVPMRRRAPEEVVAPFRRKQAELEADPDIRGWLVDWSEKHKDELEEPAMPDGIADRAADIWEPLLAVADLAGDDWPERARAAAVKVVKGRVADDASIGVRLLTDIKSLFNGHDRMSSVSLCGHLNALEESGWETWNAGKGITPRDLAKRLKGYGVESKNLKMPDGSVPKGYTREDLQDPFSRYLRDVTATSATSATQFRTEVAEVAEVADIGGTAKNQFFRGTSATSATSATQTQNEVADVAEVADATPWRDTPAFVECPVCPGWSVNLDGRCGNPNHQEPTS